MTSAEQVARLLALVPYLQSHPDAELGTTYVPQEFTAAVPEPQTYALLIAGLAMIGFAANKRRR